jgi:hypothetical protein
MKKKKRTMEREEAESKVHMSVSDKENLMIQCHHGASQ